ncbi:tyrosine-type recombinase/integrase [Kordia sp. YSTF-M3]|uniref:Tyrosine-type recombinase/integrase n=1 Tax=Kordia aestuariivivens TaxID=2759037 RepID=A0ABR7QBZ7_9FLAO|nr:site-specific integrase [Kordia aestuariivivens]MBC8755854.1 tyrosine-type recombinase/integrase [Kordia aestuariivivens]
MTNLKKDTADSCTYRSLLEIYLKSDKASIHLCFLCFENTNFMPTFNDLLQNEYVTEYSLNAKKEYSDPKIYDADGDLSKRWYVYYSFRDPNTEKLKRQPPIYKGANRFKTKAERLEILMAYKSALKKLLSEGYSPYENYKVTQAKIEKLEKVKKAQLDTQIQPNNYNAVEALDFAFKQKLPYLSDRAKVSIKSHLKRFKAWLEQQKLDKIDIKTLKRREISIFLNSLKKIDKQHKLTDEAIGAKTRNGYRTSLSLIFGQLVSDDIVEYNIITAIKKLKENPKKHKSYSDSQIKVMREYMDKNDPYLRKFTQFIAYAFLRNVEVCRLKVGDIDLENRRLYVQTKTEAKEVVPIIGSLAKVIEQMELHKYKSTDFIFSDSETCGQWNVSEKTKTNHFYDRFAIMKKELELDEDQTLYSFKHTAASNLYNSLASEGKANEQVLMELMGFTRHKTKSQLKKYLRGIGASLAKDYSNKYTIDF